jgi:hypothetical protein
MIILEKPSLKKGKERDFLTFDVRVIMDGEEVIWVSHAMVSVGGFVNGPAVCKGTRWFPQVKFSGVLRRDVEKALKDSGWRKEYPTVNWKFIDQPGQQPKDRPIVFSEREDEAYADQMREEVF